MENGWAERPVWVLRVDQEAPGDRDEVRRAARIATNPIEEMNIRGKHSGVERSGNGG